MPNRTADISRDTRETKIRLTLDLDGTGESSVETGVGFFDHMLDAFSRHSLIDLSVQASGDLHVDAHHTVEDVGIVLGQAIDKSVGDKRGISRYGWAVLPMDEALVRVAVDLGGRPTFVYHAAFNGRFIESFPVELVEEFWKSVAFNAKMNLHVEVLDGTNNHHIAEAIFKGAARAIRQAVSFDPRSTGIPSTKGSL